MPIQNKKPKAAFNPEGSKPTHGQRVAQQEGNCEVNREGSCCYRAHSTVSSCQMFPGLKHRKSMNTVHIHTKLRPAKDICLFMYLQ